MLEFDISKEGITEEEKQGVVCGDILNKIERMNVEIEDVLLEVKGVLVVIQMFRECVFLEEIVSVEVKNDLVDEIGLLIVV